MAKVSTGAVDVDRAVRDQARALGFDAVGVARADEPLDLDFARYEAFVEAGMHGTMAWLAENRETRRTLSGEGALAGAKSVVCLAKRYAPEDDGGDGSIAGHVARYARGQDYHKFLRKRVRALASFVRTLGEGVEARPMIDDAPVLERAWAARAGLGFVGKNGLLIVPGKGSFVLLGEVVTTLALLPDTPMAERCGSCTRCLDACPTNAFVAPFVLDARRCISYLTIEHEGPLDPALRDGVGEHLFGCDACQEVCPFNKGLARRPTGPLSDHDPFAPLARWREADVASFLEAPDDAWPSLLEGTPLRRVKPADLVRNALTVIANGGATEHLAKVERIAREHADEAVRAHAAWAAETLRNRLAERAETVGEGADREGSCRS